MSLDLPGARSGRTCRAMRAAQSVDAQQLCAGAARSATLGRSGASRHHGPHAGTARCHPALQSRDAATRARRLRDRLVSHEARWDGSHELGGSRPSMPAPTWRGEPLAGKTLLVWGEQGMGDVLQFCRYIPLLAERVHREGGRLHLEFVPAHGRAARTQPRLSRGPLLAGGDVESLPPFDYEIPLLSLPRMFDTREETIPASTAVSIC